MGGGEGGGEANASNNAFGLLLALLTSEKLGAPIVPGSAESRRSPQVSALRKSVMDGATKTPENTGTGAVTEGPEKAAPAVTVGPMQASSLPRTDSKGRDAPEAPKTK
jgi:hypothetical protein